MAASMNKVILIGRLGQDPKLSYTTSGQPVAEFSVATDESYKKDGQKIEATEWHRVKAWRGQAEFCANYLSKGRLVLVEGKLQTRQWEKDGQKHYTTEIVASRVEGLDRARTEGQPYEAQEGGYQRGPRPGGPQGGQQGGYRQGGQQGGPQGGQQGGPQGAPQGGAPYRDEDLGPAFPSEAGGMDDVPF